MANKKQVIDKIARNLDMLKISYSFGSDSSGNETIVYAGRVISYVSASIASPMGGIDDSVSPFLGIGIANPGKLQIKGAAGENSIAAMFTTQDDLNVLRVMSGHANNILVQAGDTTAQLAELPGSVDLLGMGM